MNISFSNFSQVLNNVSQLSGTTNSLQDSFNNQNNLLNSLAPITGTVNDLIIDFNNLSSEVDTISGNVNQNTLSLTSISGAVNSLSIDFNDLTSEVETVSGDLNILEQQFTPNELGSILTSNNGNINWSYEKYEKFNISKNESTFILNNIPLSDVVFNLDYDKNYIFSPNNLSGVNLIFSSTPNVSDILSSGYITNNNNDIILKISRDWNKPIYIMDSNNIDFGGIAYDKPYLNFGNYSTITGTRNIRNKDQLLCLGDTELYFPKGYEGYKFSFNVLSGTTNYYTTNGDIIFGGNTSGTLSDGGAISFYTNDTWFVK